MFDSIVSEATERFGLGAKTGGILSGLLQHIVTGGLKGFIEKFRRAGLGDAVSSWMGAGQNDQLSNFQVESALGADSVASIAKNAGVDKGAAASVLGFMVPKVVDTLTPDGRLPEESSLRNKLSGVLGSLGDIGGNIGSAVSGVGSAALGGIGSAVSGVGSAATGGLGAVAGGVGSAVGSARNTASDVLNTRSTGSGGLGRALKWLLPLLLLGLIAFGAYSCLNRGDSGTLTAVNSNSNRNATAAGNTANTGTAAKAIDSSFKIEAKDGKYLVSGVVPDQASADKIKAALTAQYGEGNVDVSGLKVDPNAKPFAAGWMDNLAKMLPSLKDWKNGALAFSGNAITTAEGLPQAALDQIKSLFSGWTLPVSLAGAEAATKQANEGALKELENASSLEQLIGALNVSIINFRSGSAEIPADAKPILQKAAEVLKKQPAGSVVEIGGYTDNQGNPEANKKLSQSRADAVKQALIGYGVDAVTLKAVGYGDSNPVGDNSTADGRFKNRRIEYKKADGSAPTASAGN